MTSMTMPQNDRQMTQDDHDMNLDYLNDHTGDLCLFSFLEIVSCNAMHNAHLVFPIVNAPVLT